MGAMADLKEAMKAIPGSKGLSMTYEDGGAVQAYRLGETIVRVGPTASPEEIKQALLAAIEGKP